MPGRQFSSASQYRYGFNGKEKDDEIKGDGNSLDYGAREYDPRIGRWWSTDPLQQFVGSQYSAFANSPILLTDRDGRWVPGVTSDGQIYVIAEKGDNINTLYKFFGGKDNVAKYLPTKWVSDGASALNISTGRNINFNSTNAFSKAMADVAKNPNKYASKEVDQDFHSPDADIKDQDNYLAETESKKNYNCHALAINGALGKEIPTNTEMDVDYRAKILQTKFDEVNPNQAEFGKTVISFGNQHDALYFGKDQKGTVYVISKNGPSVEPQIMKLDKLVTDYNYGKIRSPKNDNMSIDNLSKGKGGGYFNPKKEEVKK